MSPNKTHLNALIECLKIPSISSSPKHKLELENCAKWLQNFCKDNQFEECEIIKTNGHPIVYFKHGQNPNKPTVLIYGHYDVQPEDPLNLWNSPPFSPTIKNNFIYARGASDNKGQFMCHLLAIAELIKSDSELPVNIIGIIEGEEEIGSPNLAPFIKEHPDKLNADLVLISDTPMFSKDQPSICTSLRGLVYVKFTIKSAETDAHSGQHGGLAPNAIIECAHLLSKLKNEAGEIQIPGLYDDVENLSNDKDASINKLPYDKKAYCKTLGLKSTYGEERKHPYERLWYRPSLDSHGIEGGFNGEGSKTVIPKECSASFSIRLVANQKSDQVKKQVTQFLIENCPAHCDIKINHHHSAEPVSIRDKAFGIATAKKALNTVFKKAPVLHGEGGSIPVVETFQKELGLNSILVGLNFQDDNIHAPNERFCLTQFEKGIEFSKEFLMNLEQESNV